MNYFRKSLKVILLVLVVMISVFKLDISAQNISVYLNEQQIELQNNIFIENGRVMVPLRAICETLGYDVSWDERSRRINIGREGQLPCLLLWADSFEARSWGTEKRIDIAPKIIDGRTYIPLNTLVELSGVAITWDENSKSVHINRGIEPYYINIDEDSTPIWDEYNGKFAVIDGFEPFIMNPVGEENKINEYFKKQLFSTLNSMKDTKEKYKQISDWGEYFLGHLSYEVKNNKNNILSVCSSGSVGYTQAAAGLKGYMEYYDFYDTFYKDTGKRLEIQDILKGTKEDIQKIVDTTCKTSMGITKEYGPHDIDEINKIERSNLDNYNFYVQNDNLVFVITKYYDLYRYVGEFKLNILDNADLFQDAFLRNYGYNLVGNTKL